LPFDDPIAIVIKQLNDHFWHAETRVICNSLGANPFYHAQTQLPPFFSQVLLQTPIVGEFTNDQARTNFLPPRLTRPVD